MFCTSRPTNVYFVNYVLYITHNQHIRNMTSLTKYAVEIYPLWKLIIFNFGFSKKWPVHFSVRNNEEIVETDWINLKWRAKFQIFWLLIRDSGWLNFIHFSGYKHKIRLVSRLRKRKDQALISISTILKFSALIMV